MYKLHRETLHLAVDFVDRYLSATRDIKKDCLQLLGISALFIAAKLEVCLTSMQLHVFVRHYDCLRMQHGLSVAILNIGNLPTEVG